jgi:hypothetical protein
MVFWVTFPWQPFKVASQTSAEPGLKHSGKAFNCGSPETLLSTGDFLMNIKLLAE